MAGIGITPSAHEDASNPSTLSYALGKVLGYAGLSPRPENGSAPAPQSTDAAQPPREMSEEEIAAAEHALDGVQLTESEAKLERLLGNDPLAVKIRRAIIAGNHDEIPAVDELGEKYLQDLKKQPAEAMTTITKALGELPPKDFPVERASLLLAAAQLPGQEAKVHQMALREMTTVVPEARPDPANAKTDEDLDAAMSSNPSLVLPVAAHAAFLQTAQEATAAMNGTVQAVVAQQDAGVRNTIASQFMTKFPQMEQEFRAAAAAKGVQLGSTPDESE